MTTIDTGCGSWRELCKGRLKVLEPFKVRRLRSVGKPELVDDTTSSRAQLRSWVYSDVHMQSVGDTALFAGAADVKPYINVSEYFYRSTGWELENNQLKKNHHFVLSADAFHHEQQEDGTFSVVLPRLRFNAVIGWLTVHAPYETVMSKPWRLYIPGVDYTQIAVLIRFMDEQKHLTNWSLKTTLGLDNEATVLARPDSTVIYFDYAEVNGTKNIQQLADEIAKIIPSAQGPGFSLPINDSVWIGGSSEAATTSFGSALADVAADCLLRNDFTELDRAEENFRKEVDFLVG